MKLGLQLGYWGAQPPDEPRGARRRGRGSRFDAVFTAEAWGSDAYTPLAWWGSSTHRLRLGTSVIQLSARTPTATRDGRADARPPQRRSAHPRARRVRPAGGRGLVRPAVPQAAGPHPRVHRHHEAGLGAGEAGHQRRPALSAAADGRGDHRAGQGAQAHHAPVASRHPDHAGGRGAEERGAGRRDLRRLAAHLLHAADGGYLQRMARRGIRAARGAAQPRGLRDLRDRATSSSRTTALPPSRP